MTTNLYKIDDVLLRAGVIIGALALLAISKTMADGSLTLSTIVGLMLLVACPVTLLILGRNMRRREKLVVEIWRLVKAQGQVPVEQIYQMTSFGRRQIAAAVERINRKCNALLVWDEAQDVIRDDSVRRHTLTYSEDCSSCGGSVNVEVSSHETDYSCPFCGGGLDSSGINPLLEKLQTRQGLDRQQQVSFAAPVDAPSGNKISIVIFMLLLMFFWPAAVFYALKAYNS